MPALPTGPSVTSMLLSQVWTKSISETRECNLTGTLSDSPNQQVASSAMGESAICCHKIHNGHYCIDETNIGILSVFACVYVTGKACNQAFCEMPKNFSHFLK